MWSAYMCMWVYTVFSFIQLHVLNFFAYYKKTIIHMCMCLFTFMSASVYFRSFFGAVYSVTLPASPPLWGLRQSCMCFLCVYVCVCLCASVCAQTSRSAEVQLVMALLCLVGTAATVTFTNAMNQRQGGQAGRPKNNQLYSSQIDTGWTGQRERWRRTEHTPRTNKQKRMRAQTDRGPSGL